MAYPVMPLGFLGSQGDNDTYRIERSLRFNSADSANLTRTPSSAGNRLAWTLSFWLKPARLGIERHIFEPALGAGYQVFLGTDDTFTFQENSVILAKTTQVFRDTASWYHFVVTWDSANATAGDRFRIYVNGSRITSFSSSSNPSLNQLSGWNSASTIHYISRYNNAASLYFDGYLAEINFVDGSSLTPSSFGETDAITGRWKAKVYSGTYGTNGFYLKFADNSGTTATTLGKDSSGNSNNWTPNNLSVSAGVGNDSVTDSPTNSGTVGNYCTWNPLVVGDTAVNGNLDVTNDTARGTQSLLKYNAYWEITSTGGITTAGVISDGGTTNTTTIAATKTYGFRITTGGNLDYRNITDSGSWVAIQTGIGGVIFPYASTGASTTATLNAGQRDFTGAVPDGFRGICLTYEPLPIIPNPSKAFDVATYTGSGSARSITGLGFSPDLVWIKGRSGATDHAIYDTTRGVQKDLGSNLTTDETTQAQGLTAFNSDGFSIGTLAKINTNAATYVAWAWDESATDGVDIVSYTGNGANRTIAHNLGVAPKMIIVKARTTAGTDQGWPVYHALNTSAPETDYLLLNSTAATADLDTVWNDTAPTASVFSVGTNALVNTNNDTYIAYLFAEVEGFSKFGSYTGNANASGPFVWCGFRPRWILVKAVGTTSNWMILDTARDNINVSSKELGANLVTEENNATQFNGDTDINSNGFKVRTTNAQVNSSGVTYIFAAFAESPFKYARAR